MWKDLNSIIINAVVIIPPSNEFKLIGIGVIIGFSGDNSPKNDKSRIWLPYIKYEAIL